MVSSFKACIGFTVECCKCGNTLGDEEIGSVVFEEVESAKESIELYDWQLCGDLAICKSCLNEKVIANPLMEVIVKESNLVATIDKVCDNGYICYSYLTDLADGTSGGAVLADGLTNAEGKEILHPNELLL